MQKCKGLILIITLLINCSYANAQRSFAEGYLSYNMVIEDANAAPQKSNTFDGATTTIYVQGNNIRTDVLSSLGKEITIFNSKMNNAVILKEFSGQKLMITLTKENWLVKNKMYRDISFELSNEFKTIGNFNTRKAIAKMPDGKTFEVYYSPDLVSANKECDAIFINLPGLAIQYEIESGKYKFKYTLSKINYDAIQQSLFDFPTSGYRVMTYDINQKSKKVD